MKTNAAGLKIINRIDPDNNMLTVEEAEKLVINCLRIGVNENQFSALVSFAIGVGSYAFKRSILLRHVNEGKPLQAATLFGEWVLRDGMSSRDLMRRRAKERELFVRPVLVKSGGT